MFRRFHKNEKARKMHKSSKVHVNEFNPALRMKHYFLYRMIIEISKFAVKPPFYGPIPIHHQRRHDESPPYQRVETILAYTE
jgi:hypothetical protein